MNFAAEEPGRKSSSNWNYRELRASLADINESCLQLLVELAHQTGDSASDFIAELRETLRNLAEPIRSLAARTPVLLVDLEFRDPAWWKAVAADSSKVRPVPVWATSFPRPRALKLARSTLILAWHLARIDRDSSLVLMGLTAPVIDVLRALQPLQIDKIAERHFAFLRPRWEDRPCVWRQLLVDASTEKAVRAFTLRALQLTWGARLQS